MTVSCGGVAIDRQNRAQPSALNLRETEHFFLIIIITQLSDVVINIFIHILSTVTTPRFVKEIEFTAEQSCDRHTKSCSKLDIIQINCMWKRNISFVETHHYDYVHDFLMLGPIASLVISRKCFKHSTNFHSPSKTKEKTAVTKNVDKRITYGLHCL